MNTHNDGPGSLRQAIFDSSNNDTIVFDNNLDGATITLTDDQLSIAKNLTIDASSLSNGITIDANAGADDKRRILEVQEPEIRVTLNRITFINGYGPNWVGEDIQHLGAPGGAILNFGILVLTDCSFFHNRTSDGSYSTNQDLEFTEASGSGGVGGAIANWGEITATKCAFANNRTGKGSDESFFPGSSGNGGAIYNQANGCVALLNCTFSHNKANDGVPGEAWGSDGGDGGAIYNEGDLTVANCSLTNNNAGHGGEDANVEGGGRGGHGGAISNLKDLLIVGCTFANNSAGNGSGGRPGGNGGAVVGSGRIDRCTFVNNRAGDGGIVRSFRGEGGNGGAISGGGFILSNCTIVKNRAGLGELDRASKGGGVHGSVHEGGTTLISHCIISGNSSLVAPDIYGLVDVTGPNQITSGIPLLLAPLGDYGGPTHTMPPLPGSPAIDAGTTTEPENPDQRGFAGFVDGDNSGAPAVDLGAVEFQGEESEFRIIFDLDSDDDGMTSGLERALGRNPLVPDPNHPNSLRFVGFDSATGEARLTFGYLKIGTRVKLVKSTNLIDFETVVADSEIAPDFETQEGTNLIEVKDNTPPLKRAYYRLVAVQQN